MQATAMTLEPGADGRPAPGQYLTFHLADEVYGVSLLDAREIIAHGQLTSVPMTAPCIAGVINLRGSVVPVVDLACRFGVRARAPSRRTSIVIFELRDGDDVVPVGAVVDAVSAVLEVQADQISPAPAFGTDVRTDFVAGMARVDRRQLVLLDVARVLAVEELAAFAQTPEDARA